jgi:hypothetical protein
MAGICTSSTTPNACGHRTLTITLDGVPITISDVDQVQALTAEELELFVRLGVRRLRARGVPLANFLNRVTHGDEATNVKLYTFFGPGAVITKTNIPATYVNVAPGLNGERIVVDFTGVTQFRFLLSANLIGVGPFAARCVRDSDSAVLIESLNLGAAGERELDSGWADLPAAFVGAGETFLRVQAKSTTITDDPVFRRCDLGLR